MVNSTPWNYIYVFTHISVDLSIRLDCVPEVLAKEDSKTDKASTDGPEMREQDWCFEWESNPWHNDRSGTGTKQSVCSDDGTVATEANSKTLVCCDDGRHESQWMKGTTRVLKTKKEKRPTGFF